jgi:hypothetical protein
MPLLRKFSRKGLFSKRTQGVLLLALFLSLLALANSAALHTALHPNATSADHHCAVTLLSSGQVQAGTVTVLCPVPPTVVIGLVFVSPSFEAGASFNLPLSRGPPALLS